MKQAEIVERPDGITVILRRRVVRGLLLALVCFVVAAILALGYAFTEFGASRPPGVRLLGLMLSGPFVILGLGSALSGMRRQRFHFGTSSEGAAFPGTVVDLTKVTCFHLRSYGDVGHAVMLVEPGSGAVEPLTWGKRDAGLVESALVQRCPDLHPRACHERGGALGERWHLDASMPWTSRVHFAPRGVVSSILAGVAAFLMMLYVAMIAPMLASWPLAIAVVAGVILIALATTRMGARLTMGFPPPLEMHVDATDIDVQWARRSQRIPLAEVTGVRTVARELAGYTWSCDLEIRHAGGPTRLGLWLDEDDALALVKALCNRHPVLRYQPAALPAIPTPANARGQKGVGSR